MPFGLKNALAVFQSMMDRVLGPLRNITAVAYLDDIIIHSKSPTQHIRDVEQVLSGLRAANLSINKDKCAFGLTSVEFLGFIVSKKRYFGKSRQNCTYIGFICSNKYKRTGTISWSMWGISKIH